jgi:hypothetical protein
MDGINGRRVLRGNEARVLCDAVVDLVSRVQRPWLFKVTVTGKPPHSVTRVYEIAAKTDNLAAMTGIEKFVKEMSRPLAILQ